MKFNRFLCLLHTIIIQIQQFFSYFKQFSSIFCQLLNNFFYENFDFIFEVLKNLVCTTFFHLVKFLKNFETFFCILNDFYHIFQKRAIFQVVLSVLRIFNGFFWQFQHFLQNLINFYDILNNCCHILKNFNFYLF